MINKRDFFASYLLYRPNNLRWEIYKIKKDISNETTEIMVGNMS